MSLCDSWEMREADEFIFSLKKKKKEREIHKISYRACFVYCVLRPCLPNEEYRRVSTSEEMEH